MKKIITKSIIVTFTLVFLFTQEACIKDTCHSTHTYTYFEPVYKTTAEVRANIKSNAPKAITDPGKIYIKGNYIFLNEINKGIHVIDNTDPASPKNIGFIDIPGNVDIAVKGNTMYADLYTDLVVLDITNPLNITAAKFVDNLFPERYYNGYKADSSRVIVDWVKKEKTEVGSCNAILYCGSCQGVLLSNMSPGPLASGSGSSSTVGISGSLARFALVNDYLYTVGNYSFNVVNTTAAFNPLFVRKIDIGFGLETIYPFKDKLFIGTTTGMHIYGLQDPSTPARLGSFAHARSCDPVIADNNNAYVTLHSGSLCQGFSNQLDVLDITNIQSPLLVKSYPLTSPRGLSKDGNLLFICDGDDGLKLFNAAVPNNITLIKKIAIPGTEDVIAYNNIALVIAKDGLYQFDYSNPADIKLKSKILVGN